MKRAILCVGVNRYVEPGINDLDYAEADATEVYGFFQHRARYDAALHLAAPDPGEVLDSAREMVARLAPGDLFVFFFSGHGYEFLGRHLLLCPKARLNRLQFFQETVPVDLLKEETQKAGVDRVFVLDACRKDLRRDRGGPSGLCGAQGLRNIVAASGDVLAGGAFTLLCACDEGEQAREMPELKRGLFTCALLEEMKVADHAQTELRLDDKWEEQLHARMGQLAALHGMPSNQRPWIKRSGGVPVLLRGAAVTQGQPHPSETEVKVKCPICGRRNLDGTTFECQHCHRDHLCEAHWTEAGRCCEQCAEKAAQTKTEQRRKAEEALEKERLSQEKAEAEQKAREEVARQQREAEARRLAGLQIGSSRRLDLGGGVSLDLCGIPAGEFRMGTLDGCDDEKPVGLVRITQPFWMGKYAVTQAQYRAVMGANPSRHQGADKPVHDVSWEDATEFCQRLSQKVGQTVRLPTEAEWEYACRAGTTTQYYHGDSEDGLATVAWYGRPRGEGPQRVGQKRPNLWGLYDMHGNVWEWCQDWYGPYPGVDEADPQGPATGSFRVVRGGCWYSYAIYCRTAFRGNGYYPTNSYNSIGFRPVLPPGQP